MALDGGFQRTRFGSAARERPSARCLVQRLIGQQPDDETGTLLTALLGAVSVATFSGGEWPQFKNNFISHGVSERRLWGHRCPAGAAHALSFGYARRNEWLAPRGFVRDQNRYSKRPFDASLGNRGAGPRKSSPELAAALVKGKLDIAFLRPERNLPILAYKVQRTEPLIAVMPANHWLTAAKTIRPHDIVGETLIGVPTTTAPVLREITDMKPKICRWRSHSRHSITGNARTTELDGCKCGARRKRY